VPAEGCVLHSSARAVLYRLLHYQVHQALLSLPVRMHHGVLPHPQVHHSLHPGLL
jgi:hypothetical protein